MDMISSNSKIRPWLLQRENGSRSASRGKAATSPEKGASGKSRSAPDDAEEELIKRKAREEEYKGMLTGSGSFEYFTPSALSSPSAAIFSPSDAMLTYSGSYEYFTPFTFCSPFAAAFRHHHQGDADPPNSSAHRNNRNSPPNPTRICSYYI